MDTRINGYKGLAYNQGSNMIHMVNCNERLRILNTSPQAGRRIGMNVKLGSEKFKERSRNTFGEDVSNLKVGGHMLGAKFASDNEFPKEMII